MKDIIISMIIIVFPILMYLVFSCYNAMNNKKITGMVFIVTMITSLYLGILFNDYMGEVNLLLLFCNIPILICYFKKELLLGVLLSIILIIFGYLKYDMNILIACLKGVMYLGTYVILNKRKDFRYLFFKVVAIIQGFFISFEYFMKDYQGIDKFVELILYTVVVYGLVLFCLYLFKLADDVANLYTMINRVTEENKLKNSLFKLTHEIKNPLAVCKGYLDMINFDNMEKSKKYLEIIKSEINRSLNVMSDFMQYSKVKINKEIIDMNILLDEICNSFSLLLNDKKIRLEYVNSYEEIYLWGDYERIKQVFVNVIKNSIESIVDNGIIKIDVKIIKKDVVVLVSDNGVGMDHDELENIKEMFFTTKRNGTGLGVALSNEIILAHGGKMDYSSVKDKGTECQIILPL